MIVLVVILGVYPRRPPRLNADRPLRSTSVVQILRARGLLLMPGFLHVTAADLAAVAPEIVLCARSGSS